MCFDAKNVPKLYQLALREIEGLMHAKMDTPEGQRLDALVEQVEAYEKANILNPSQAEE